MTNIYMIFYYYCIKNEIMTNKFRIEKRVEGMGVLAWEDYKYFKVYVFTLIIITIFHNKIQTSAHSFHLF